MDYETTGQPLRTGSRGTDRGTSTELRLSTSEALVSASATLEAGKDPGFSASAHESSTQLEERFWAKVQKTESCWIWIGGLSSGGYGSFWDRSRRQMCNAHRFAYERLVGPVPAGLQLDHLCRVRACIRPDHLEPVTQAENQRRGLTPKLTHTQVEEIRALATTDLFQVEIARRYGVSRGAIREIWKALAWEGSGTPVVWRRRPKGRSPTKPGRQGQRLTRTQATEIRSLCADGLKQADVALRFGVSACLVNNIVQGRAWRPDSKRPESYGTGRWAKKGATYPRGGDDQHSGFPANRTPIQGDSLRCSRESAEMQLDEPLGSGGDHTALTATGRGAR